jgi:tRNA dimethylallyltransferase
MSRTRLLIVLAGPTAVGKTDLSIQLAKHFNCPIINGDSRQVYQEISIGTAKVTEKEMDGVPHYFVGSHSIHTPLSAGAYEKEVIPVVDKLFNTHTHLILTGGSGLFLKAVYDGLDDFSSISDETKNKVQSIFDKSGIEGLQQEVQLVDPNYYKNVDTENPRRLMRALEVYYQMGKTYSSLRLNKQKERNFDTAKIMLDRNREELYERINLRAELMMKNGLMEEVKSLKEYSDLRSLQTVGYTETFEFLSGYNDLPSTIQTIQMNTRRYAKRQLTWFRREVDFKWFHPSKKEEMIKFIEQR